MKKTHLFLVFLAFFLLLNSESNAFFNTEKSGKTVYGFCIYDESWNGAKPFGLYSFNNTNPSVITKVWSTNLSVNAAAYYDGFYYAQTSVHNGASYLSMEFGKFDANNGEYSKIADWSAILPQFTDLTIDYSTAPPTLIGLKAVSVGTWRLVKINMENGNIEYLSNSNSIGSFFGIACGQDGTVYTVNNWTDGTSLQTIDRTTGRLTTIGQLGVTPKFLQSMDFDRTDGTLYWAVTDDDYQGRFGTINISTGQYKNIGTVGRNAEFVGLNIPFSTGVSGVPSSVTDFTVTPAANGVKTAELKWKTPTLDNTGSTLTALNAIKIYRNDELIQTINNPSLGSNGNFIDNVSQNGLFIYKIIAENSVGVSVATLYRAFIGEDIPKPPSNIVLKRDENNAILTWDQPTEGLNGGWVNLSKIKYKISRKQGYGVSTNINSNVSGTTYTDKTVPVKGCYIYTVYSFSDSGVSYGEDSNPLYIGKDLSMPFSCQFTEDLWKQWTVIDANKDNYSWKYYNNDDDIVHCTANREMAADDWLISPPINLAEGSYKLIFEYKAKNVNKFEKLKVFYGQGETVVDQKNMIVFLDNFNHNDIRTETAVITVTNQGAYNFSFYVCSDAGQDGIQIKSAKLEKMGSDDLEVIKVKGNILPVINTENNYTVFVRNAGSSTQNSFTVQLIDEFDNILTTKNINEDITVNQTKEVIVNWTPNSTGLKKIRGKVILEGDLDNSNDVNQPLQIEVQPEGYKVLTIGTGTSELGGTPFDATWNTSTQQIIYHKDEIGIDGAMIRKIFIPYKNTNKNGFSTPRKFKVFLANTDRTSMDEGWMPDYEFTKVYDGNIQILSGEGYIILSLSKPFLYSGNNLCVMFTKGLDNDLFYDLKFYVNQTNDNRLMRYGSSTVEFNGNQQGTLIKLLPNLLFQIDANRAGTMDGIVKCNQDIIEGVKITLSPTGITTLTDNTGHYYFGYVPAGTYNISTSKHGYSNNSLMGIVVNEFELTTTDIALQVLPSYTVLGNVKDIDGNNLQGAMIKITGYESYDATTDSEGNFSITGVYRSNNYSIRIKSMGLETYNGSFNVVNSDINLGSINLKDIIKSPENIEVTVNTSGAEIKWDKPAATTTFRYDDGVVAGFRGFPNGTDKSVLGSVYRTAAVLESMSWFTGGDIVYGGPHSTVNIFVFDLDGNGSPYNKILFSQTDVPNVDDNWNIFNFPQQLDCPNGFMIAISYSGYLGLGRDAGTSTQWPYIPQTSYSCSDYTKDQFLYETGSKTYNYMVRAEGYDMSRNDKSLSYSNSPRKKMFDNTNNIKTNELILSRNQSVNDMICNPINTVSQSVSDIQERSVKAYKVWRLKEGEENTESKWTLLTMQQITEQQYLDTDWLTLSSGIYKYAVKAIFTNEVSKAAFSPMVPKDMLNDVTINVTTNTPSNKATGAIVKLTNKDNNPEHIYTGIVNESGKATITDIWKGTYTVNIYLYGFEKYEAKNVKLQDGTLTLNYQIDEITIKPYDLKIETTEQEFDRIFSWQGISFDNITDDFEKYSNFKFNPSLDIKWSYIDGDGAPTNYLVSNSFPNQGEPMAYIIFNPSATTPALNNDDAILPWSGNKFLASFASYGKPNEDYLISPELYFNSDFFVDFMAKTYISDYGLERFRIGYSVTGNQKSDFKYWLNDGTFTEVPTEWTEYSFAFPKEARYITIECVSNDALLFMIDDISIGLQPSRGFTNYEVYLNGSKMGITTENTYQFTDLSKGKHIAGVRAVYESKNTEIAEIEFEVTPDNIKNINNLTLGLYPNPVINVLNITGEFSSFKIFNESGKLILSNDYKKQIDFKNLPSGIYFIEFIIGDKKETYNVIKK